MRLIVTIFACLGILFAGGCLVMGGGQFVPLAFLLLAIIALNVGAIFAAKRTFKAAGWFLIGFGLADLVLAAFLLYLSNDQYVGDVIIFAALVVVAKGLSEIAFGVKQVSAER